MMRGSSSDQSKRFHSHQGGDSPSVNDAEYRGKTAGHATFAHKKMRARAQSHGRVAIPTRSPGFLRGGTHGCPKL
jgi:hypothetical protein